MSPDALSGDLLIASSGGNSTNSNASEASSDVTVSAVTPVDWTPSMTAVKVQG